MSGINVRYDNPLLFSVDKTLILRTDSSVSYCISNWTGYTLRDLAVQIVTIPFGGVLHEHRINELIRDQTIYCGTIPNLNVYSYRGEAFYRLVGRADPGNLPVEMPIRIFIDSGSVAHVADKRVFTFGYHNGHLYMRVDEGSYHLVDDVQFAIYEKEDGTSAVRVPSRDSEYVPLNFRPNMTYIIDIAHRFPNRLSLARALFVANPFLTRYVKFDFIQSEEDAEKVIKLVLPFVLENYVRSFYVPVVKVDLDNNTLIEEYMITVKGAVFGLFAVGLIALGSFVAGAIWGRPILEKLLPSLFSSPGTEQALRQLVEARMEDLDAIERGMKNTVEVSRNMSLEIVHALRPEALNIPKEELIRRINDVSNSASRDIETIIKSRKEEKIEMPLRVGPSLFDIALIGLAGAGVGILVSQYLSSRDRSRQ